MKKINDEKRAFDKQRGKREHEFFIPAGSKIMVASYVHLRREGLEGYMTDFNGMVREVMAITGDIGIEVVPCVPVIFGGLDDIGRELLGGVREWLCWIAKKSGREEFVKLSETGGREAEERRGDEKVVFWRPSFMLMHGRQNGMDVLLTRGNTLTLIRGERTETVFKRALPASEIGRMKGTTTERDEEKREREDFGNGIFIEGEFAFTKALGDFCKVAVGGGRFKGNYRFNLKGQMRQRAGMGLRNVEEASMVILGGSQMGRMKDEIVELKDGMRVEKMVKMQGEWTDETVNKALSELARLEGYPGIVVVGGPGNSVMRHGAGDSRGFAPEWTIKVRKTGGAVRGMEVRYHTIVEGLCGVVPRSIGGILDDVPKTR